MQKVESVFDKISEMGDELAQKQFESKQHSNIVPIRGDTMVV
ncbi:hypothetical protein [Eubacterium sp. MSJ-13]|nr:hypothetical protein [Eubacterium sp. MSJ-13]